jgi:hypothetical protein
MSREFVDAMEKGDNLEAENAFKNSIISKVGDALEVKRKGLANTFVRTATTKTEVENTDDAEV